jgi:hypothetical protein
MTFENLPQSVISQSIDNLIQSNPGAPMSRGDWFEYLEANYKINSVVTNGFTHYFLEPIN